MIANLLMIHGSTSLVYTRRRGGRYTAPYLQAERGTTKYYKNKVKANGIGQQVIIHNIASKSAEKLSV